MQKMLDVIRSRSPNTAKLHSFENDPVTIFCGPYCEEKVFICSSSMGFHDNLREYRNLTFTRTCYPILMKILSNYFPDLYLPTGCWKRIVFRTSLLSSITCVIAIAGSAFANGTTIQSLPLRDILVAIGLSIVLTIPVIGTFAFKIEELNLAYAKLQRQATIDSLTGAMNRAAFIAATEQHLANDEGDYARCIGSLLALDVDSFKTVNDLFGHHLGDDALQRIAATARMQIRDVDLLGRMGGEEFAIFLVGAELNLALAIAERVRLAISDIQFKPQGTHHALSVSIGVYTLKDNKSFAEVYNASDRLLYRAKNNGRNRVEFDHRQQSAAKTDRRAVFADS